MYEKWHVAEVEGWKMQQRFRPQLWGGGSKWKDGKRTKDSSVGLGRSFKRRHVAEAEGLKRKDRIFSKN